MTRHFGGNNIELFHTRRLFIQFYHKIMLHNTYYKDTLILFARYIYLSIVIIDVIRAEAKPSRVARCKVNKLFRPETLNDSTKKGVHSNTFGWSTVIMGIIYIV